MRRKADSSHEELKPNLYQGVTGQEIVSTLSTQLSWSHFIELPPLPLLRARLHQAIEDARESAVRRLLPSGVVE